MDLLSQSSLIVAIVGFSLGFSCLARNVSHKLFIWFCVLCLTISAWALFFFLSRYYGVPPFAEIHWFLNLWLAPAGLMFLGELLGGSRGSQVLKWLSVGLAVTLSLALAWGFEKDAVWIKPVALFSPGLLLLQVLLFLTDRSPSPSGERRGWIYLGAVFVLSTSVLDHAPFLGPVIPVIGNIGLVIYLSFLHHAVTRSRPLHPGEYVSRFILVLILAGLLTAIYSLLFNWIHDKPALFLLNSFVISFWIVMLWEPVRALAGFLSRGMRSNIQREMEVSLGHATEKLGRATHLSEVSQVIGDLIARWMEPTGISIYTFDQSDHSDQAGLQRIWGDYSAFYLSSKNPDFAPLIAECERIAASQEPSYLIRESLRARLSQTLRKSKRDESLVAVLNAMDRISCSVAFVLGDEDGERGKLSGIVLVQCSVNPAPMAGHWGYLSLWTPFLKSAARSLRSASGFDRYRKVEQLALLGELSAGLAHEIRNPLGAISGAAQVLSKRKQAGSNSGDEMLDVILDETRRLNRVVGQFLEYSRTDIFEDGKFDTQGPKGERIELYDFIQKSVAKMKPGLPPHISVSVIKGFEDRSPQGNGSWSVMGSEDSLHQVVLNLVQNSVISVSQSENPDPIEIRVGGSDWNANIEIVDRGIGIPAENLEKIFNPFFTTNPDGTGLGLSISRKIIEAHRGKLEIESELGKGTKARIILPRASLATGSFS